jgi:hypothetical protein
VLLSLLSLVGLGTGTLGSGNVGSTFAGSASTTMYYDVSGHPVCYANLTAYGESGTVGDGPEGSAWWQNGTYPPTENSGWISAYQMYYDTAGQQPIRFADIATNTFGEGTKVVGSSFFQVGTMGALGLIGIVVALMLFATLVGVHFFGSGESDISVGMILKCTGYISLWAVFSVLGMNLLMLIPLIGVIMYFMLTLVYVLGMVDSIGFPQN